MPSPDPLEPPESGHSPRPWLSLDRLGITQALGGLAIGLIALLPPMTTSPSPVAPSSSPNNGASPSSLPRWRSFLSMLNWRPVRDIEARTNALRRESEMIKNETERIKNEAEQIKNEAEQIKREAEQIKNETELLRRENAMLRRLNAKAQILLSSVDQLCFPPESSSIPPTPTEPDSKPSSP